MIYYAGNKLTIHFTSDAEKTYNEIQASTKEGYLISFKALVYRLADFGKLRSPDQFRIENRKNPKAWAIKGKDGIRAYGWQIKNGFVISHFIKKKKDKLDQKDIEKVKKNIKTFNEE